MLTIKAIMNLLNRSNHTPEPTITEDSVEHKPNLSICGGGRSVSSSELMSVPTPPSTHTYRPIPHYDLVTKVKYACASHGLNITDENHLLDGDDKRYFGLFSVESNFTGLQDSARKQGVFNIIGLRNSHDKSFPAGIMAGDAPFVCSNLCFSNEIVFGRKHTVNFFRDIDHLVDRAVAGTLTLLDKQAVRNNRYINKSLTDVEAHDAIIRAWQAGACNTTDLPKVLKYYNEGTDGFTARNLWSLKNAFTALHRDNVFHSSRRSGALHHAFDELAFVA